MLQVEYFLVDVFAELPLEGNALAVFHDAARIPDDLLQPIAREMNLSETTFVMEARPNGYRSRIFSPSAELPFAGHPTLGTAWVLRHLGILEGDTTLQTTEAGETRIGFSGDLVSFTRGGDPGSDLLDVSQIATALGIPAQDIGVGAGEIGQSDVSLSPAAVNAGVEQLMVPVASPDIVAGLHPPRAVTSAPTGGVYVFSFTGPRRIKARFFTPELGVAEDPATGSAAAALGVYLGERIGDCEFEIRQGDEIERPSTIHVRVRGGVATVSGKVVLAGSGHLELPV